MPLILVRIAATIIFALAFGWLSRMCGGGPPLQNKFSIGKKWLTAVPYALYFVAGGHWIGAAVSVGFAALAKLTGHGRGQSLKEPLIGQPEKIEILTLWAKSHLPVYWYKAFVLLALGLLRSVPAGICAGIVENPLCGAILAATGLFMPISYMVGWAIYPEEGGNKGIPNLTQPTQIGEFGTDFLPALVIGWFLALRFIYPSTVSYWNL